ncbi:hypothetical protein BC834DRAFT_1034443, partial [Gloeopeniophorella convolvens]
FLEGSSEISLLRWIQSSRYEIRLQVQGTSASETLYTSLTQFTDDTIQRPFGLTEAKAQPFKLKDYVSKWLQSHPLWDPEVEYVFDRLGNSLAQTETQKTFGVCRDIFSHFGVELSNA